MKKISILLLVIVAALASCKKVPEVNTEYVDVERDLITVGMTTATVQCDYLYIATLKNAYFHYGEGQNEADMNTAEMRVVQNTLYVDLVGLKENTIYSYYYEFFNGFNSMRSATKTFKTEASPVTPPEITLPTVVTAEVSEITSNSAQCGGEVTNDGGAEVTERGICWSTNANPTLNDSHIASGTGTGAFIAMMNSLEANTTYHVRAYATNEKGTAYGLDREFTTLVYVPEGAINGLFSVDSLGHQVYFSQGNLQYTISTQIWSFMEHQFDIVEMDGLVGDSYSNQDVVSLFGWGTSGWNNSNLYYQPFNTEYSDVGDCGFGYGPTDGTNYHFDLTGDYANSDWGVYNAIANGGNAPRLWRTLTKTEWWYVLCRRSTVSAILYVKARVNDVNGIVILPDDWNESIYEFNNPNSTSNNYTENEINIENWIVLETKGAVFLPASGVRPKFVDGNNHVVSYVGEDGGYWSATANANYGAYELSFNSWTMNILWEQGRDIGCSVRLVQDANK